MERTGRVHRLPDDVDTDQIIPGEYLTTVPDEELGQYALRGYDPTFADRVERGDVIVAGENFGLGSSRESAPVALRNAGVGAVVAESFARIFYRNAINVGLPIATVPGIADRVSDGDVLRVDVATGDVEDVTTGETFTFDPLPPDLLEILEAGGLVALRRRRRG
ncbi:3-isopropylmalate dehydratase small subunit [Halomarina pelagica]|uniref:3-isopropylmalate dehydratase small subunit n=1 Tax=Halomarina pelagica TaxID=2961599 RepID=UPI0020C25D9A|nr:3-isopropylmalate dehydratase small subunit [Halomarina sp. BND7]